MHDQIDNIAVIGAGMAGLACATRLAADGRQVVLFDKARGVGGRMSTRRIATAKGEAAFDHGAQFFTARDEAFRAQVDAWRQTGLVAPWPAAGEDAFVGTPAMNAPLKALADALDVRWSTRVQTIEHDGKRWRLCAEASNAVATSGHFDAVVAAVPAEQAAPLLHAHAAAISTIADAARSQPCWTLMLAFARPVAHSGDVLRDRGAIGWACRNSAKPGRGGIEAWLVQGNADWSAAHLENDADAVVDALTAELRTALGTDLPPILAQSAHRWRYARAGHAETSLLWDRERRIGACGDWLLGPRVECAWRSGTALAEAMLAG